MNIRNYLDSDYGQLMALYDKSDLYGGQRDDNRDSKAKLQAVTSHDPEAILIAEYNGRIVGTVSLIEDGRVAWLFRFAVEQSKDEKAILGQLYAAASRILKHRGHNQVLVYSPVGHTHLDTRYTALLGFEKGSNFTCFWKDI